jgi:hypothetical protein
MKRWVALALDLSQKLPSPRTVEFAQGAIGQPVLAVEEATE